MADASVRRARPTDAPAVGLVQLQSMRTDYAGVLPAPALTAIAGLSEADLAGVWRQALTEPPSPRHRLLVACAGDQVVGLAAFGPSDDQDGDEETADLATLAVHPRARRQGHGSRLLNAVVDEARGAGFTWLTTWVPMEAPHMRAFLQGAGMDPDRARRERIVDDAGGTLLEVRLGASLQPAAGNE
nr:GNAT family N-acetyltransferase [Kineosphaera limosa]